MAVGSGDKIEKIRALKDGGERRANGPPRPRRWTAFLRIR